MNKDFLLYTHTDLNWGSFNNIINDIDKFNPKEILLYNPLECTMAYVADKKEITILEKKLTEKKIKFYYLIGAENIQILHGDVFLFKNLEILFWPTSLLHHFFYVMGNKKPKIKSDYDKVYTCLNGRARYHRAMLLDELKKNDLFEYGHITWNEMIENHTHGHKYDFKYWEERLLNYDGNNYGNYAYDYDSLSKPNSFLDIVTETSITQNFITEKTYKSIYLERAFLCLGARGCNLNLKKYGFELFDEIFDYEFDSCYMLENKVEGIIDNVKKLIDYDLNVAFNILENKIKNNKNNFLSIVNFDPYIPNKFVEFYKKYQNQFEEKYENGIHNYLNSIMKNI